MGPFTGPGYIGRKSPAATSAFIFYHIFKSNTNLPPKFMVGVFKTEDVVGTVGVLVILCLLPTGVDVSLPNGASGLFKN